MAISALISLIVGLLVLALVYFVLVKYVVDANSTIGKIVTAIFVFVGLLDVLHFIGVY